MNHLRSACPLPIFIFYMAPTTTFHTQKWAKTHQSVHYLKNHPLSRLLNGFQAYFLLVQTARNFLFTLKQGVKTWEQTQM